MNNHILNNVSVLEVGNSLSEQLVGLHLSNLGAYVKTLSPPQTKMTQVLTKGKTIISELDNHFYNVVITKNIDKGKIHSKTIYLSLPCFSSTDKEYKNIEEHDANVMAASGVFIDMGIDRVLMGIRASYTQLPLPSTYASIYGTLAILNALNKNSGDIIEVPLASALMDTLIYNSIDYNYPTVYNPPRNSSNKTNLTYSEIQDLKDPFFCHYICYDKRPFYLVAPCHINHQKKVLKILGIEEKVQKLNIPVPDTYNKPTHGLGTIHVGNKYKQLKIIMADVFKNKTAFEWEILLGDNGIPCSAHRTTNEWIYSKHAINSKLITIENDIAYPCPVAWIETEDNVTMSDNNIDNITVLDMSNVIAGPTIGSILARFGFNVIKIDSPKPTYSPEVTIIYGLVANTNKKSILLNVKTGKDVIIKLIKKSDVLIINHTEEGITRLGLSVDTLKKINPNLILMRFDAWGGPNKGPRTNHLGYDDNIQAGLGIMERFGGGMHRVEEHAHLGTIDVIAGVSGALSVMAALYYRKTHNGFLISRTSLASLGQLIQIPFICGCDDNIRTGSECKGEHDLLSIYETKNNKWVMLLGKTKEKLVKLDIRFKNDTIKNVFMLNTAEYWKDKLNIVILTSMKELRNKYKINGDTFQFITFNDHPIGSPVTMFASCSIRSNKFSFKSKNIAPKYGEHTIEILKKYDIDTKYLLEKKIISEKWSKDYLPT